MGVWIETKMTPDECRSIASEGERSLREGDAVKGIKTLEKALRCDIGDLSLQSSLHSQLGNAYYARGDYQKAKLHHMSDFYASRAQKDELQQAKALSNLSATYTLLLDFDNAVDCAKNVINFARKIGDKTLECRGIYSLGLAYLHCATRGITDTYDEEQLIRNLEQSVECFELHLAIAKERQDCVMCGLGLGNLGNAYFYLGEYGLSIEHHEKRIEVAKELGDQSSIRRSYSNIANAYTLMGDYEMARKFYRLALELALEMNIPELVSQLNEDLENASHFLAKQDQKLADLPVNQFADTSCTNGGINSSFGTESTNLRLSNVTNTDEHSDREEFFDQIARLTNNRMGDQRAEPPTPQEIESHMGTASENRQLSLPRRIIKRIVASTPKQGKTQKDNESVTSTDKRPKSASSLKIGFGKVVKNGIKKEPK